MRLALITILLFSLIFTTTQCVRPSMPDGYVPVGTYAKVSDGDDKFYGFREGQVPFADTAESYWLYSSAFGVKDADAVNSMLESGRVIYVPLGTSVDIVEHDTNKVATKVRIRGGKFIGRELWTHPRNLSPVFTN